MCCYRCFGGSQTMSRVPAAVIDVFCGAGGLTHGFKLEGFAIACGIDADEECRYAFEKNNKAPFVHRDIMEVSGAELLTKYSQYGQYKRILVGCAPCQAFSLYNQKREYENWNLVGEFGRLVSETQADIISMENVPQMKKFQNGKILDDFLKILKKNEYYVWHEIVYCPDYGVPQNRSRFVLLASKLGEIKIIPPSHLEKNYITVGDTIKYLPKIKCGDISKHDFLHRCSRMSKLNKKRIKASKPGGSWKDWNYSLRCLCHRKNSGRGYSNVYGRMSWGELAPTITTKFCGFGNGRFGHPKQNRAISLREGALLQTFPKNYIFNKPCDIKLTKTGRMIGNAVPVRLSRAIARTINLHIRGF